MSKQVIVFGATGEIGSRIAAGCQQAGHQVIGVSRGLNQRHKVDLDGIEFIYGDKSDENFIKSIAENYTFDVIIDSVPALDHLKLFHKHFHDVSNVIICSSTGTFAPLQSYPATEEHSWRNDTGINFFWQCQRDAWALERFSEDGFPITILRPAIIGGYGRVPLEIWGGREIEFWRKIANSEPVMVPDYYDRVLFQVGCNNDLATAFVNAVGKGTAIHGEIIIITSKYAITQKQYLAAGMNFLKSSSKIIPVPVEKLFETYGKLLSKKNSNFAKEHICFDIAKAEKMLDYKPQSSPEQGLVLGLQWCIDTGLLKQQEL